VALLGGLGREERLVAMEWAGMIAAVLVFSPQTTSRHMVMLLPLVAVAGALLLREEVWRRRVAVGSALVVFFLGQLLGMPEGGGVDAWRFIGGPSWVTLGLVFVCLWRVVGEERQEEAATDERR